MLPNDEIRLKHMLAAVREAISFSVDKAREDLDNNRMLVLSVLKCIEIIGEAASRVTIETQKDYPSIPWASIIGMRNRLIHTYYSINLDTVWDTVANELPTLEKELHSIVKV